MLRVGIAFGDTNSSRIFKFSFFFLSRNRVDYLHGPMFDLLDLCKIQFASMLMYKRRARTYKVVSLPVGIVAVARKPLELHENYVHV